MATLQALLQQAKQVFPDEAVARFFVQGIANKTRFELYADKSSVSQDILDEAQKLLSAYKPNMPVQYLLHKTYFLSYELYVDERVMIPRFETEDLVMKTAARIKNPAAILDIGTGSGAIAIALADIFPKARIVATDISADAIEVAKVNINKYKFADRIQLCPADLFPNIIDGKFDLIISNPPYIPDNEIKSLSPTVKDFEPLIALDGGKQGFEVTAKIIKTAKERLNPDGLLALEIDPGQAGLIKSIVSWAEFENDNQGLIRYAFINHREIIEKSSAFSAVSAVKNKGG